MYTWETIEKTLHYIEDHLKEEIKTQTLADLAGLSPYYYQRLFKKLVRKPVQEYIKLRRLALVLVPLRDNTQRIIDIAFLFGFSSHANFTRAFKEVYHLTPETYRRDFPMLNSFEKPDLSIHYSMVDENVPLIVNDIILEIHKITLEIPEVYLGYEAEIKINENTPPGESTGICAPGELWKFFHEQIKEWKDIVDIHQRLGMSSSANMEKGTFSYFAGAKANTKKIPSSMVKKQFHKGITSYVK